MENNLKYRYVEEYSTKEDEALLWLKKQTNLRTTRSRMLCGAVEGKLLEFISKMVSPMAVLEIGTFTGYSAICLARGLRNGGFVDSLEINDELEDLILEGFDIAGMSDKINLIIGDAKESLSKLKNEGKSYDLVFIDANKREYVEYYNLIIEIVKPGGYILADNVLWDGKVFDLENNRDSQTQGIHSFNQLVNEDNRVENIILPIRDGLSIIRKIM